MENLPNVCFPLVNQFTEVSDLNAVVAWGYQVVITVRNYLCVYCVYSGEASGGRWIRQVSCHVSGLRQVVLDRVGSTSSATRVC